MHHKIVFRCFSTTALAGKKVGFLGLGNMGLPMASNLKKAGFEVQGFDLGEKQRKDAAIGGNQINLKKFWDFTDNKNDKIDLADDNFNS